MLALYLSKSKHGYEISVVGESQNTARYIGINVKKVIIRTMILSGAICGLAGFLIVAGADHTVSADTAGGRGFTAILVSWLAYFKPIAMVLTSFLVAFIEKGSAQVATYANLGGAFPKIMTGIFFFFIIASEFFINYRVHFHLKKHQEVAATIPSEDTPVSSEIEEQKDESEEEITIVQVEEPQGEDVSEAAPTEEQVEALIEETKEAE